MKNMYAHYYAVIMAGGGGTRLWPLSRKTNPKQMMKLEEDRSLFRVAVDRLDGLFPPERIFVVTVKEQAVELMKICPEIPEKNYLIEPFPKGTASVVGLAAVVLEHMDENASMVVLTADHFIENVTGFQNALRAAYQAGQQNTLVTLGIEPTFPSTGFGYIERGQQAGAFDGLEVYAVQRFTEKPVLKLAENYVQDGDHFWNSGMFIWQTKTILKEFEKQMPDLYGILMDIQKMLQNSGWNDNITPLWEKIKPQTIDYGIMENAGQAVVIPVGNLGWNDVGAWNSLYDVLDHDQDGNIIRHPNYIGLKTKGSIVFSGGSDRLIVTIGVEDLIVIETEDALLICTRENAQEVKEVVNRLKLEKRENYL